MFVPCASASTSICDTAFRLAVLRCFKFHHVVWTHKVKWLALRVTPVSNQPSLITSAHAGAEDSLDAARSRCLQRSQFIEDTVRRTLFFLPGIISLFNMCVGIIWNNSLVGSRDLTGLRFELRPLKALRSTAHGARVLALGHMGRQSSTSFISTKYGEHCSSAPKLKEQSLSAAWPSLCFPCSDALAKLSSLNADVWTVHCGQG